MGGKPIYFRTERFPINIDEKTPYVHDVNTYKATAAGCVVQKIVIITPKTRDRIFIFLFEGAEYKSRGMFIVSVNNIPHNNGIIYSGSGMVISVNHMIPPFESVSFHGTVVIPFIARNINMKNGL